jgi:protein-tyrosine phosphatase
VPAGGPASAADGELVRLDLVHEQTAAGNAGPRFDRYPIEDLGVPDHHEVRPLIDDLADRLRQGRYVSIHCRAGIGRSSLVAAAVLIRLGVAPEQVSAAPMDSQSTDRVNTVTTGQRQISVVALVAWEERRCRGRPNSATLFANPTRSASRT